MRLLELGDGHPTSALGQLGTDRELESGTPHQVLTGPGADPGGGQRSADAAADLPTGSGAGPSFPFVE